MKYKTYVINDKSFIERLVFPRFKGEITFNPDGSSDVENIELLDNCNDAMELAKAMRLAGEFLLKGHQIKEK